MVEESNVQNIPMEPQEDQTSSDPLDSGGASTDASEDRNKEDRE